MTVLVIVVILELWSKGRWGGFGFSRDVSGAGVNNGVIRGDVGVRGLVLLVVSVLLMAVIILEW